jgi:hypothetical protein
MYEGGTDIYQSINQEGGTHANEIDASSGLPFVDQATKDKA